LGEFNHPSTTLQSGLVGFDSPVAATALIGPLQDNQHFVWQARVRYRPSQSPFLPHSPWATPSGNGLFESDVLSTSTEDPGECLTPDEEVYISTLSIDGNGKPVIHYQDPNQPSEVTGYNIYRASAPMGPFDLLGYYEVASFNAVCSAEGPY
jgi:hypothetical protein